MAALKGPVARPLSPHLQIYRPMLTMMMSIVHRITGGALYFGTLLLAWWLVAAATLSAFAGAFLGTRLITKVTMRQVQVTVAAMLALAALGLASGLV